MITDPKLIFVHLYLFGRYIVRYCKKMNSLEVMKSALLAVLEQQSMTVRELADLFAVKHSLMSSVISGMEKDGLVRKNARPDDPRFRVVSISEKGRGGVENIHRIMKQHCSSAMKDFTDEEIRLFDQFIQKINFDYILSHPKSASS
jgi:DNA-binding MarR family transcriptional regulator